MVRTTTNVMFVPCLVQYSYVAAFFNKQMNSQWMKLNQDMLLIVLKVIETIELTTNDDIRLMINSLNYLHLLTDCSSWKALQRNLSE
jgi:uncharacterized membrane protein